MKKAVLLGGTSAIGCQIAKRLAVLGYEVLFTYHRNAEAAAALQRDCAGAAFGVQLDLASMEAVHAFLSDLDGCDAPHTFVNSAGAVEDRLCISSVEESLHRITMINYIAPALISCRMASLMAPLRAGFIVHITSASARKAKVGNAVYGAAKIALERFTASLALEVARFRVRTLCIAPAFVDTPMFEAFAGQNRERIIREVPMRQILQPDQVAEMVLQFVEGKVATTGSSFVLGNGESVFL